MQKGREYYFQTTEKGFFIVQCLIFLITDKQGISKQRLSAACYLIYRDLILCNVLYIYTSVINCTLDKKED